MAIFKKRDKGRARRDRDYHDISIAAARNNLSYWGDRMWAWEAYKESMAMFGAKPTAFAKFMKELR